ncbi:aquaporin-like protein [Neolentinus lepideus HHB14362 ss-1]|uniref:Aquaporin-like protein n=1 Tax=Neolentinus lepideus HHB14362 ss-1 TaxID=1314782 RepID=A0A165SZL3_9AGAM|nr:aquaporin-like protein [Neolentinus lepideus HHB14362 ss-1]
MVRPQRLSTQESFATLGDDLFAAFLEFIGTTFFLLFALGGVQAVTAEQESPNGVDKTLYVSLCFGFSLAVFAWLFYRVTGGLFNPNVSLALFLCGVIGPVRFVLYCIAQLVGSIAASALVLALTPGPLAGNTKLASGINSSQGVFIEMFVTSALVLSILMLAAEKHQSTPLAPVGIGLTLFIAELWSVYYTGGSANTARAFGPAVVTGFPDGHHWVYWVGPFLGSLLASLFYAILKHYRYWRLNPEQDTTRHEKSPPDPVHRITSQIQQV